MIIGLRWARKSLQIRDGSVLLGDSHPLNLNWLYADTFNQIVAYFANGNYFRTSKANTNLNGVFIVSGGNAWNNYSDKQHETNFELMNDRQTLFKL